MRCPLSIVPSRFHLNVASVDGGPGVEDVGFALFGVVSGLENLTSACSVCNRAAFGCTSTYAHAAVTQKGVSVALLCH